MYTVNGQEYRKALISPREESKVTASLAARLHASRLDCPMGLVIDERSDSPVARAGVGRGIYGRFSRMTAAR